MKPDSAAAAAIIALLFCVLGVIGANEWQSDRIARLERENARLSQNIRLIGCAAPDRVAYASDVTRRQK